MKDFAFILLSAALALPSALGAQSGIPDNPDSLFESGGENPQPAAPTPPFQAKGVEVGGTLFSDYTGFLNWTGAYPDLGNPAAGASSLFVPDLEADLYLDARPFDNLRVFAKIKAAYPFSTTAAAAGLQSPFVPNLPGVSVFEVYADLNFNDSLYFRAGQQVVNWGVGYFFSPADIISLTPINPLQPTLERAGPLALKVNAPFAEVDNLYLYVIANQAFAQIGSFRLDELAVAPKVEVLLGGWEVGLGGYYQQNQRPKAMMTATGSLFGQLGLLAEGVLRRGMDTVVVQESTSAPGTFLSSIDTATPTFSGTIGVRYLQADWHISFIAQYCYNGQGYADSAGERAAKAAYTLQAQGTPPLGPQLSQSDAFQPGRHYLAGQISWTDILSSRVDLAVFYEGNLSDGSGVTSPSISFTPFRNFMLTFAPWISYGADNTEFVSMFGRFSLSLKLTMGAGSF